MISKFIYSDLFKLLPQPLKVSKLNFTPNGKTPAYSSDTTNNGCLGFVNIEPTFCITDKTPVYLIFGDHTRTMNIVHEDFCVMDNVKVLVPKTKMSDEVLLYIITAWKKAIPNLGYARHWSVAKNAKFDLPTIKSANPAHKYTVDDIDWQYMQERIAELEQERIAELEQERIAELDAYLKITGLEDYELTEEDRKIPCHQGCFKKYMLGSLFTALTGDVDLQQKDINGKGYPVVSSGLDNQGVIGYSDIPAKVLPANTITIDMFGNVFFRDFEYKEVTHARIFTLIPKSFELSVGTGLYIVSILSRQTKRFSYNNMATWNKLRNVEISLPVLQSGEIDFDYMERYIRAIEKLVIVDVVKYKDKVIATTKKVVNSST